MPLLRRHWFLVVMVGLIGFGLAGGANEWSLARVVARWVEPAVTTFIVLFLMAFTLDSGRLWDSSVRRPLPFLWASLVNAAVLPLIAWGLLPLQRSADFSAGLMIAASVPCTLATASVWTRRARGNDAVTLLTTLVTSGLCFLVAPFWLGLTTGQTVPIDARKLMVGLLWAGLAPTILGQLARAIPNAPEVARRRSGLISAVVSTLILLLVLTGACRAGLQMAASHATPGLAAAAIAGLSCIVVHVVGMGIAVLGARRFRFRREDVIAVAFASSQKTLPIGVLIATDPSGFGNPNLLGPGQGMPFALFPMLMFHAAQLFIDTAIAARMAAKEPP